MTRMVREHNYPVTGHPGISHFREPRGFLLAELLPALVVSILVFALLSPVFVAMNRSMSYLDHSMRVRQTIGACLHRMISDVRMAGCNPWGISPLIGFEPTPKGKGIGNGLLLRFDRRGTSIGSFPDGDLDDPDEIVSYEWSDADGVLRRNRQPMALDIVENPGQRPIFEWIKTGENRLVVLCLTMNLIGGEKPFSLSTKVWVRNPP